MRLKTASIILAAMALAWPGRSMAELVQPLTAEQAAEVKRMILPNEGEIPFWRIDWLNDMWEARQKAAAEGKPIFVWGGSEGAPITNC